MLKKILNELTKHLQLKKTTYQRKSFWNRKDSNFYNKVVEWNRSDAEANNALMRTTAYSVKCDADSFSVSLESEDDNDSDEKKKTAHKSLN